MKKSEPIALAVIGGSGLYSISGLTDEKIYELDTPFGIPSAPIVVGMLEGRRVAFLARHGMGHQHAPSSINYRANLYALKSLGVERIIGINACGSLREDFSPGHIVIPDQVFDFTRERPRSFFEHGLVAHIGVADPFCRHLSALTVEALGSTGAVVHSAGTYVAIEGPRFSTRAESNAFRAWGMSIVGMTCAPEVFLAREAEMCYAVMAHVTDYDVWHLTEAPVSVETVVHTLNKNTSIAQDAIRNLVRNLPDGRSCSCGSSLAGALITDPGSIAPDERRKLDLLIGKYLPPAAKI